MEFIFLIGRLRNADACVPLGGLSTDCEGEPLSAPPLGLKFSDLRNHDSALKDVPSVPRQSLQPAENSCDLTPIQPEASSKDAAIGLSPRFPPMYLPLQPGVSRPYPGSPFISLTSLLSPLPATLSVMEAMATGGGGQRYRVA